jgi:DNA-binding HxlR family transcriptional regulator
MSTNPSAAPPGRRVLVPEAWRSQASSGEAESGPSEPASGPPAPRAPRPLSPVETTAALLRGRFTALVVWHLFWGGKRFYQLVRELSGVPRKAIAHELEELERAGIVARRVQSHGPAKVEYQLTPLGERLKIVVGAMYEWGLLSRRLEKPAAPAEVPPPDEASH